VENCQLQGASNVLSVQGYFAIRIVTRGFVEGRETVKSELGVSRMNLLRAEIEEETRLKSVELACEAALGCGRLLRDGRFGP